MKCITVCLRCEATVDEGCCLCPNGDPGETDTISQDEHEAWKAGTPPSCFAQTKGESA